MSEIKEIPLENSSEIPEIEEPAQQELEETPKPKARAKGRPKGSTNKPKEKKAEPAPKVKKAPPKKKAPVYESEEESEEEEPVPRKRSKAPQVFQAPELDRRALAADVLELLSEHKFNRAAAKRNHYASWFA